jgi:hypothetical protein
MGRGKSRQVLELVAGAKAILEQIQPATVRAVCYRLFVAGVTGSMTKAETNRVSRHLTWAREAGIIPWSWVVDETREPERVSAWEDPAAYVETVKQAYRRDRWVDQPNWIEVWSEKGTVRGTLAPVLTDYGITFRVMHGYGSATALHQVAMETRGCEKPLTVLYVGDWDPSGLHMSQVDLPRRLEAYGGSVHVLRLALSVEDIGNGNLPFFSAHDKRRDPRFQWYRQYFRHPRCWELDALSPVILRDRVEQAILHRLDRDAWDRAEQTEAAEQESLTTILTAWPGISRQASKYEGRT